MEATETAQEPKRGPGRPPKVPSDGAPVRSGHAVDVIYHPREGDLAHTTVGRHKFMAGVPRQVKDPDLIKMLRANPWFEVVGEERAKDSKPPPLPKTPEEYRVHAIRWTNAATSAGELRQLWLEEAALRDACKFGTDDFERVMSIYNPKYAELSKFEGR